MAKATKQKPVSVHRLGTLQCAIFKNKKGLSYSFSKSYLDKQKNWQSMRISLFPSELPAFMQIVREVSDHHLQKGV